MQILIFSAPSFRSALMIAGGGEFEAIRPDVELSQPAVRTRPRRAPRAIFSLFLCALALSCPACSQPVQNGVPPSSHQGLVPFDAAVGAGIGPEIDAGTGRPQYTLSYVLSADGTAITTRFRGPSEALCAGLTLRREERDGWHVLLSAVNGWTEAPLFARWRSAPDGTVADAWVRVAPVLEVRAGKRRAGRPRAAVEWRPLVNGVGAGPWRTPRWASHPELRGQ